MPRMILPEPGTIKTMTPEELLKCFRPLVYKVAMKYMAEAQRLVYVDSDDLIQTGYIALIEAQQAYDTEQNANFLTFAYNKISWGIMRLLGWRWTPEEKLLIKEPTLNRLDAPVSEEDPEGLSLVDMIQDPDIEDFSEDVARQELAEAVRAAVQRLKNDRQRDYISRIFLQGEPVSSIAKKDGRTIGAVHSIKAVGLQNLRHDYHLREYRPHFSTSLQSFRHTFTSEEEAYVLWAESHQGNNQKSDDQESKADRIREIWNREHADPIR